jgi:fibronectin type 3 domain-containing protein
MALLLSPKSIGVLAAVVLSAVATASQAAPGAFQLTGYASCDGNTPAVYLEWTRSSGATSYELVRDDGQHTIMALATSTFDTNVVTGGPAHSYFVRASDGSGTTDSNTVTAAPYATACSPPPAPFTITGKAICFPGDPNHTMNPAEKLDWHSALYATSYDIYKNGAFYHAINGGSAALFTFIGFPILDGPTNSYYIVAKNAAGTTTSNTVTFTIPADICATEPPVAVLSGSAQCHPQTHQPVVSLSWTLVPEAFGWQLYRDGAPYVMPHSGLGYVDTNVVPGHTYTYNIATYGLGAPLSNPITVAVSDAVCTPGPLVVTPQVLCNNNSSVVRLVWSASPNAASYTVTRDGTALASGINSASTYFDDTSAVAGATYSYGVTAVNNSGSTASPPVTVTVDDEVCPPGPFTASAASTCFHDAPAVSVTWSGSAHAASYVVSRDGVEISGALPATARQYIDGAASLAYHAYTVKASNARSYQSSSIASTTLSKAPCGSVPDTFTASVSGFCHQGAPAVRIDWSVASGASSYTVTRNGVTFPGQQTFAPGVYFDASVVTGQTYTYTVVASNANGNNIAPAGTITPSLGDCPPGPLTLTAVTACQQPVRLFWTAASNHVLNYLIFRDQLLVTTISPNILTYADNEARPGGSHDYFVRASGTGGMTESNVAHVTVAPTACEGTAPDLAAIDVRPSASSARAGDTITVNVELANLGNATAAASTARIRFGRGLSTSSSDPVLTTIALPPIVSGGNVQRTVTVKLPAVVAGTYYLFFSVDEEHVSGDEHFGDNVKASAPLNLSEMIPPKRRAATH